MELSGKDRNKNETTIRILNFQLSLRNRINDAGKLKCLESSSFYSRFFLFLSQNRNKSMHKTRNGITSNAKNLQLTGGFLES